jgi:formylglycine-generating enzyme
MVSIALLVGACGGGQRAGTRDAAGDGLRGDRSPVRDAAADGFADGARTADGPVDAGSHQDARADRAPDRAPDGPASTTDAACDPDAMPQPNAGLVEKVTTEGCFAGMIAISGTTPFCIDRYEGALVRQSDLSPWSPYLNPGTTPVRAVSLAGAVPQSNISGTQAAAACAAAGKRLCTDAEWLRVCQGPLGTTYPYGATRMPGVCNDARAVNPVISYFGSNDPSVFSMIGNACIDQQPGSLARTGAYAGCVTAEGAFDMMGNLHEWTADPAGTFRGGYYGDTTLNGDGCLYATTAHDAAYWDYSTGFRCCM